MRHATPNALPAVGQGPIDPGRVDPGSVGPPSASPPGGGDPPLIGGPLADAPLADAPLADAPLADAPLAALLAPGEPLRALVVDDEPRLRQLLVRVLNREGFECRDAPDGAAALAELDRWPAPLVLSDLRMPHLGGVELLRGVRERHPDAAVVIVTAVADVETAVRCLAMGAADYLTKPFHLDEVRARVRQALSRRRLVLENRAYQRALEARVAHQAHRLEQLFLASVTSLADALEVKDPYTSGHSLRVGRYATAVGRVMGADADTLRQLELGGRLHDLGKIGVREEVLNKGGPLTHDEYAHIMQHPVIGWRLLHPLLVDAPLALAVVRSHHERPDGRGAPDGLAGEAVPAVARIAAVADSFDAMTSHRPYRRGLSLAEAMAELRRHAGTQFDPEAVAAFEHAVGAGAITLDD
jgi:response regulator RpfG family c-di-GMP phosphodiesterase